VRGDETQSSVRLSKKSEHAGSEKRASGREGCARMDAWTACGSLCNGVVVLLIRRMRLTDCFWFLTLPLENAKSRRLMFAPRRLMFAPSLTASVWKR